MPPELGKLYDHLLKHNPNLVSGGTKEDFISRFSDEKSLRKLYQHLGKHSPNIVKGGDENSFVTKFGQEKGFLDRVMDSFNSSTPTKVALPGKPMEEQEKVKESVPWIEANAKGLAGMSNAEINTSHEEELYNSINENKKLVQEANQAIANGDLETQKENYFKVEGNARKGYKDAETILTDFDPDFSFETLDKSLAKIDQYKLLKKNNPNLEPDASVKEAYSYLEKANNNQNYKDYLEFGNQLNSTKALKYKLFPEQKQVDLDHKLNQRTADKVSKESGALYRNIVEPINDVAMNTYEALLKVSASIENSVMGIVPEDIKDAVGYSDPDRLLSQSNEIDWAESQKSSNIKGSYKENYVPLDNGKIAVYESGELAYARDKDGYQVDLSEDEIAKANNIKEKDGLKSKRNYNVLGQNLQKAGVDLAAQIVMARGLGGLGVTNATASTLISTSAQVFGDYYRTAIENGASSEDAYSSAILKSTLDGFLENIGGMEAKLIKGGVSPDIIRSVRSDFREAIISGRIATKNLPAAYLEYIVKRSPNAVKSGLGETLEEITQGFEQGVVDKIVLNDNSDLAREQAHQLEETSIISFLLGAGANTAQGAASLNKDFRNNVVINGYSQLLNNVDRSIATINSSKVDAPNKAGLINTLNYLKGELDSRDIESNNLEAISLATSKLAIEIKLRDPNLSDSAKSKYKSQIDEIDKKLDELPKEGIQDDNVEDNIEDSVPDDEMGTQQTNEEGDESPADFANRRRRNPVTEPTPEASTAAQGAVEDIPEVVPETQSPANPVTEPIAEANPTQEPEVQSSDGLEDTPEHSPNVIQPTTLSEVIGDTLFEDEQGNRGTIDIDEGGKVEFIYDGGVRELGNVESLGDPNVESLGLKPISISENNNVFNVGNSTYVVENPTEAVVYSEDGKVKSVRVSENTESGVQEKVLEGVEAEELAYRIKLKEIYERGDIKEFGEALGAELDTIQETTGDATTTEVEPNKENRKALPGTVFSSKNGTDYVIDSYNKNGDIKFHYTDRNGKIVRGVWDKKDFDGHISDGNLTISEKTSKTSDEKKEEAKSNVSEKEFKELKTKDPKKAADIGRKAIKKGDRVTVKDKNGKVIKRNVEVLEVSPDKKTIKTELNGKYSKVDINQVENNNSKNIVKSINENPELKSEFKKEDKSEPTIGKSSSQVARDKAQAEYDEKSAARKEELESNSGVTTETPSSAPSTTAQTPTPKVSKPSSLPIRSLESFELRQVQETINAGVVIPTKHSSINKAEPNDTIIYRGVIYQVISRDRQGLNVVGPGGVKNYIDLKFPVTTSDVVLDVSLFPFKPKGSFSLESQVDSVTSALSKIIPNLNIVVLSNEDYVKQTGSQTSKGQYIRKDGNVTIYVNKDKALNTTLFHEATHAVLLHFFEINDPRIHQFHQTISAILKTSIYPEERELAKELDRFIKSYKDGNIKPHEYLAEFVGYLAANRVKLSKPSLVDRLIESLNELLFNLIGVKPFTSTSDINDIINLFNNIAVNLSNGQVIADDLGPLNTEDAEFDQTNIVTKDGTPIGYNYNTELVARERFNIDSLDKISQGGSDRDVYYLGDGKVLKVAKSARGLEQNMYEGDWVLTNESILPEVFEAGLNYVVTEFTSTKAPTPEAALELKTLLKDLSQFTQSDFDKRTNAIQDVLYKHGLDTILSFDLLYGDFKSLRNWGFKNGHPIHLDGGTFGGVRMLNKYRGKKNLEDPDFREVYHRSRQAKKLANATDNITMYQESNFEESVSEELSIATDYLIKYPNKDSNSYYQGNKKTLDNLGITPEMIDEYKKNKELYEPTTTTGKDDEAYTSFVNNMLNSNLLSDDDKDYLRENAAEKVHVTIESLNAIASDFVADVRSTEDIKNKARAVYANMQKRQQGDVTGWHFLALDKLATFAEELGDKKLANKIRMEIGWVASNMGRDIVSIRGIYNKHTILKAARSKLLAGLFNKDEKGRTVYSKLEEFLNSLGLSDKEIEPYLASLEKDLSKFKSKDFEGLGLDQKDNVSLEKFAKSILDPKKSSKTENLLSESLVSFRLSKKSNNETSTDIRIKLAGDVKNKVLTLDELIWARDNILTLKDTYSNAELAELKNEIDDIIAHITDKPFGTSDLRKAIKEQIGTDVSQKALKDKLLEIARDRAKGETFETALVESIISKTGLSAEEALKAEEIIRNSFDKILSKVVAEKVKAAAHKNIRGNIDAIQARIDSLLADPSKASEIKKLEELKKDIEKKAAKDLKRLGLEGYKERQKAKELKEEINKVKAKIETIKGSTKNNSGEVYTLKQKKEDIEPLQKDLDSLRKELKGVLGELNTIASKQAQKAYEAAKVELAKIETELKELIIDTFLSRDETIARTTELNERKNKLEKAIKDYESKDSVAKKKAEQALVWLINKPQTIANLLEIVMKGDLTPEHIMSYFSNIYDLNPSLTSKDIDKMNKLTNRINNAKLQVVKDRLTKELLGFIQDKVEGDLNKKSFLKHIYEFLYTNLLSNLLGGVQALTANLKQFLTSFVVDLLGVGIKELLNLVVNKDALGSNFTNWYSSIGEGLRGAKNARRSVGAALLEGEVIGTIDAAEAQKLLSQGQFFARKSTKSAKTIFNAIKSAINKLPISKKLKIEGDSKVNWKDAFGLIWYVFSAASRSYILSDIGSKSFTIPYYRSRNAYYELLKDLDPENKNNVDLLYSVHKLISQSDSLLKTVAELENTTIDPNDGESAKSKQQRLLPVDDEGNKLTGKALDSWRAEVSEQLIPEFLDKRLSEAQEAQKSDEEQATAKLIDAALTKAQQAAVDKSGAESGTSLPAGTLGGMANWILALKAAESTPKAAKALLFAALTFAKSMGNMVALAARITPLGILQSKLDKDNKLAKPSWDPNIKKINNAADFFKAIPGAANAILGLGSLKLRDERRVYTDGSAGSLESRPLTSKELLDQAILSSIAVVAPLIIFNMFFELTPCPEEDETCIQLKQNSGYRVTGPSKIPGVNEFAYKDGWEPNALQKFDKEKNRWENWFTFKNFAAGILFSGFGEASDAIRLDPNSSRKREKLKFMGDIITGTIKNTASYGLEGGLSLLSGLSKILGGEKINSWEDPVQDVAEKVTAPFLPGSGFAGFVSYLEQSFGRSAKDAKSPNSDVGKFLQEYHLGFLNKIGAKTPLLSNTFNEAYDALGFPVVLNKRTVLEESLSGLPKRPKAWEPVAKFPEASNEIKPYNYYDKSDTEDKDKNYESIYKNMPFTLLDDIKKSAALMKRKVLEEEHDTLMKLDDPKDMKKALAEINEKINSHAFVEQVLKNNPQLEEVANKFTVKGETPYLRRLYAKDKLTTYLYDNKLALNNGKITSNKWIEGDPIKQEQKELKQRKRGE